MLVILQNSVFTLTLLLYNIKLTFIITHTLFQLHSNHKIYIKQNPQLKSFGICGFQSPNQKNAKGHD